MNQDRVEAAGESLKGKAEDAVGKITNDQRTEASGKLDEAKGKLQDAYGQGQEKVQGALGDIADYAKANPWMALGAALGTGLLIGHVSGRSKRKIVYVSRVKPNEVK